MKRKVAYLAHPLGIGGDREKNIENATDWLSYLQLAMPGIAFTANWILIASRWSEEDGRSLGLDLDKTHVENADFIVLVGGRVSPGMAIERQHAVDNEVLCIDLTGLGYPVPLSVNKETYRALETAMLELKKSLTLAEVMRRLLADQ